MNTIVVVAAWGKAASLTQPVAGISLWRRLASHVGHARLSGLLLVVDPQEAPQALPALSVDTPCRTVCVSSPEEAASAIKGLCASRGKRVDGEEGLSIVLLDAGVLPDVDLLASLSSRPARDREALCLPGLLYWRIREPSYDLAPLFGADGFEKQWEHLAKYATFVAVSQEIQMVPRPTPGGEGLFSELVGMCSTSGQNVAEGSGGPGPLLGCLFFPRDGALDVERHLLKEAAVRRYGAPWLIISRVIEQPICAKAMEIFRPFSSSPRAIISAGLAVGGLGALGLISTRAPFAFLGVVLLLVGMAVFGCGRIVAMIRLEDNAFLRRLDLVGGLVVHLLSVSALAFGAWLESGSPFGPFMAGITGISLVLTGLLSAWQAVSRRLRPEYEEVKSEGGGMDQEGGNQAGHGGPGKTMGAAVHPVALERIGGLFHSAALGEARYMLAILAISGQLHLYLPTTALLSLASLAFRVQEIFFSRSR